MGRQGDRQGDLMVMWSEMPRSPGHVFYDRLQEVLVGAGFDGFVEDTCRAFYAKTMGAPSVPPGRYFRMHMVGYFEGIDSERGIEWRCCAAGPGARVRGFAAARGPETLWLSGISARETNRGFARTEDFWFIVAARSEDEAEIRAGQGAGRSRCQRHPARHAAPLLGRGQDPHRARGPARG